MDIARRSFLAGSGSILFARSGSARQDVLVQPTGALDDEMLDQAVLQAVRTGSPLRMRSGQYRRGTAWRLPPSLMMEAEPGASLVGANGCAIGIQIEAGDLSGHGMIALPALGTFTDCGLELRGCALARVDVPAIGACGTAIRMTTTGSAHALLDNIVSFDAIYECGTACAVRGFGGNDVIQGNVLRGNFVTTTATTVLYEGFMCSCDGLCFAFEAVDITADRGGGSFIANRMRVDPTHPHPNETTVPRSTFVIRSWAGGDGFALAARGGPAQLIDGTFSELKYDIRTTREWLAENYRQPTSAVMGADIVLNRTGNVIAPFRALEVIDVRDGRGLSRFRDGQPVAMDAFMVTIRVSAGQRQGSSQAFVYAMFTDRYDSPWEVRAVGGDLSRVASLTAIDQSAIEDHRICVLINYLDGEPGPFELVARLERRH